MTRIYTRTGDDGTTGLIGGRRVSKDSSRIIAYGTVDELNAVLGLARGHGLPERVDGIVGRVQDDLFILGAHLALPEGADQSTWAIPPVTVEHIQALERDIDACQTELPPLHQFVLPGGTVPGALLHLSRTVARRAERYCVALAREEQIDAQIVRYLNRLSDLCFVLARHVNHQSGNTEHHPTFGKK